MEKEKNDWRFLCVAMAEIRESLQLATSYSYLLNNDEYHPTMASDERKYALDHLDDTLWLIESQLGRLSDLAYYSSMEKLEYSDRVLLNRLCRDLVNDQDVKVIFETDIPDYYAIKTNEEALSKILSTLLDQAVYRVLNRRTNRRAQQVTLTVTERGEEGKLTFVVTDTGDVASREDDITTFDPPTEKPSNSTMKAVGYCNCKLMVDLLGGFIYIDPKYRDGRRVVFDIALK